MIQRYRPNTGRRDLDRFLEGVFGSFLNSNTGFWSYTPDKGYTAGKLIPIDLSVDGDNVIVRAELPGMDSKNLMVEVAKNMLKIEANTEESADEDSEGYVIRERRVGSMKRAIRLPHSVDPETATSTYKDGVLEITLPKAEKSQSRQIPIN
jgi:HSP20 family protein